MRKTIGWLRTREQQLLLWANRRPAYKRNEWVGRWLSLITHTGGATFTLATALLAAWLAPSPWNITGWKCLLAVIISHIPVAIVKRKFRRLRPYQALPEVNTGKKPLKDSSFPSGHTTAIFAWLIPIVFMNMFLVVIVPLALLVGVSVGWSRMYLGLHYPSDVAAGAMLGATTAIAVEYLWMPFI
ncbi:phosphatase PAP2 family protein [Paenibacillus protaetiae]|uniref:Phosphatase PAP2 family protein n=1 Tax=Paenibacillus protaetiae TaxID=2509456 RepID=A0A4P6F112_9BACL|nr:phosphatase PAP2 family protein [Paenibacillus protaetiae]QAY66707.1 phosphatase PAP2 family protein [Paenibacillus protaetiae]